MASVILKKGREKSLLRHHPWIFSGAIHTIKGSPQAGETVDVFSAEGNWLASGAYSPASQISVRVWSFDRNQEIAPAFFHDRLKRAIQSRNFLISGMNLSACRLVNSESDGLPGLVVDRYGEFLVCQFLTAGIEFWKEAITNQLVKLEPCQGIYERSDVDVRTKEGLALTSGVLWGDRPPEKLEIREGPVRFWVDVHSGHKTGFYLDQRDNRLAVAEYSKGAAVLNCFSYSGGFGVWALKGGAASLVNIDSSADALELARLNLELNGLKGANVENLTADVFKALRKFRDSRRRFDLIILDPPKFVESRSHLTRASRGYKDINMLAFELLNPGGMLFTFSCSGLMTGELFQKIVADAALDAGCDAQIIRRFGQSADHPVALNFPEGHYLKGLLIRKI